MKTYGPAVVPLFEDCVECGQSLDQEQRNQRLSMHGECAERSIARSTEIFETYRNGGRIEGLFDGVGPP